MKKTVNREKLGKVYHPLRDRIVRAIDASEKGMMSPNALSKALDERLSNVSYHVKTLVEYDCLELVKTEPRRGALEHFYRVLDGVLLEPQGESLALMNIARIVPKGVGDTGIMGSIAAELRKVGYDPDEIDGDQLAEAA